MKTIIKQRTERLQSINAVVTLWCAMLSILFLASPSLLADNGTCQASRNSSSVYNDFRNKYPFHFQTVGLAEYSDNSCLFLVAEPTPEVTEEDIRRVFDQKDYSLEIKKHQLGYDGYIKDVLIVVRSISHEQIVQLEKKLHKLLFSSEYKAERATLELPVKKSKAFFSKDNINYKISLAELNDWFMTKDELFVNASGERLGVKFLLKSNRSGVFLSENPGFVAWVINKSDNLYLKKSAIRQFVLDSDLLLGAFSNAKKLIIIGRERQAGSLQELQPLCIETVLMLAAYRDPSLSQSLDMNDVLAGEVTGRNYDWCPTYLSDILENTEYGNLLTINDVLLKDWSESGKLQFFDVKYPEPNSYPFNKPLSVLLNQQGQKCIVYNWNTTGAVYSMRMSDYSIYALSNTGALPVSYYNDQYSNVSAGESYEKKAYQYFAEINNTDLARAVQYSFLYSVFYDNAIYAHTAYVTKKASSMKPYLLEGKVRILLNNIKNASPSEIINIAHNIALPISQEQFDGFIEAEKKRARADFEKMIQKEIKDKNLNNSDPDVILWKNECRSMFEKELNELINQSFNENTKQIEEQIVQPIKEVQNILKSMNAIEFSQSCKFLSYPRGEEVAEIGENSKIRRLANAVNNLDLIEGDLYKPFGIKKNEVMDYYSRTLRNEESAWIKTPTLTRTHLGNRFVGGHNIAALIKRVSPISGRVPKGDCIVNNDVIHKRADIIPQTTRIHRGL